MKLFDYINRALGIQTDVRQCYYPDGQLASERSYKGDKLNGPFKDYHPNGQLQREGEYKNGRPDGEWKLYYDNGQQSALCHFDEGENVGFWMDKNREGKTIAEYDYDDGVRRDYLPTELLEEKATKDRSKGMKL